MWALPRHFILPFPQPFQTFPVGFTGKFAPLFVPTGDDGQIECSFPVQRVVLHIGAPPHLVQRSQAFLLAPTKPGGVPVMPSTHFTHVFVLQQRGRSMWQGGGHLLAHGTFRGIRLQRQLFPQSGPKLVQPLLFVSHAFLDRGSQQHRGGVLFAGPVQMFFDHAQHMVVAQSFRDQQRVPLLVVGALPGSTRPQQFKHDPVVPKLRGQD